ncbi:hypothetical protein F5Y16DRAFT_357328 [Xylariaceae sp. FL0255]|nr:hypothetical protein F5Y16DRAFT_357328 [Xylariaceae sp. FL0255]
MGKSHPVPLSPTYLPPLPLVCIVGAMHIVRQFCLHVHTLGTVGRHTRCPLPPNRIPARCEHDTSPIISMPNQRLTASSCRALCSASHLAPSELSFNTPPSPLPHHFNPPSPLPRSTNGSNLLIRVCNHGPREHRYSPQTTFILFFLDQSCF